MNKTNDVLLQQRMANPTSKFEKFKSKLERVLGQSAIKNIGRMFRNFDDDGNRSLSMMEFRKGMTERSVGLTDEEILYLFHQFDVDGTGMIDYNEFLHAIRGPMSNNRLRVVDLAFKKLDKTGNGTITVEDLEEYDPRHHAKYKNGVWTARQCLREFLDTFDTKDHGDGIVTKEEFFNYYYGVSASIDDDAYFDLMMRNAWKL